MPRSAEELLEFGRLREIVCGFNTCAPGRRAVEALKFSQDRGKLAAEFALIREAMEWLRGSNELGFGGLADPDPWLTRLEPGASEIAASTTVLAPRGIIGRGVAARYVCVVENTFPRSARIISWSFCAGRIAGGFSADFYRHSENSFAGRNN